jgi:hypothetical protein
MALRSKAQAALAAAALAGGLSAGALVTAPQASAAVSNGIDQTGYEAAFTSTTGGLTGFNCTWPNGNALGGCNGAGTGQTMAPGTSPSITTVNLTTYEMAFQAGTGSLSITGALGTGSLGLGMMPGTSPSIAALAEGGYEIAFHYTDGRLFGFGSLLAGPVIDARSPSGIQMAPGASPALAGIIMPTFLGGGAAPSFEMFYEDTTGKLRYVIGSAFSTAYTNPAAWIGTIDPGTIPAVASFAP